MNREIKFRAWDTEIKEMVRFLNLNITKGEVSAPNCSPLREDGFEYWNFKPMPQIILMQYTGLKDKNGKEIYEGDIVKFIEYGHERVGSVVYSEHDGAWDVRFKFGKLDPMDIIIRSQGLSDFEVIGNIYESDIDNLLQ